MTHIMIALFIGRFQPFHEGHLDALKQIKEKNIIIGIGSAQYSGTLDNPYSFTERKKMIEKALSNSQLNYKIVAIPDINDPPHWVEHVEKIVEKFAIVYTGNNFVAELFKEKKYPIKLLKKNINISGTEIRKKMYEKTRKNPKIF